MQALTVFVFFMNAGLFYLLQTIGRQIWQLFLLSLPLSMVKVSNNVIYPAAVVMAILLLAFCLYRNRISLCAFVVLHSLLLALTISVMVLATQACRACYTVTLPSQPSITAHRGCPSEELLENSIESFQKASQFNSVITLESDVQISSDGVLFLLHDDYFARTTSIRETCPHINLFTDASTLSYHTSDCPINSLHLKGGPNQAVPTFDSLLTVAKESGRNVIFDLRTPYQGHPFEDQMVNLTLSSIKRSGIDLEKVHTGGIRHTCIQ